MRDSVNNVIFIPVETQSSQWRPSLCPEAAHNLVILLLGWATPTLGCDGP